MHDINPNKLISIDYDFFVFSLDVDVKMFFFVVVA